MTSDARFCVSDGTVEPPKNMTLGMTVKTVTSSGKIIYILNRFGHCCNNTKLKELQTEIMFSSAHLSEVNPLMCHIHLKQMKHN